MSAPGLLPPQARVAMEEAENLCSNGALCGGIIAWKPDSARKFLLVCNGLLLQDDMLMICSLI